MLKLSTTLLLLLLSSPLWGIETTLAHEKSNTLPVKDIVQLSESIFRDPAQKAESSISKGLTIEIVYSKDSTALLRSINALKNNMDKQISKGDTNYQKQKKALLEQEILLIELNDSEFDRSGVNPIAMKKFDWKDSVSTILQPIFVSLNSLTEKPRRISETEQELEYMKRRVTSLNHGIQVFEQIKDEYTEKSKSYQTLIQVKEYWTHKLDEANRKELHLKEKFSALGREKPIADRVNAGIAKAFTNKLTTIVWAILAAAFTYVSFNWIANLFNQLENKSNNQRTKLFHRLWFFSIRVLSSFLALLSVFIVLYLRSDWVLLGLSLITLFFLAIGLKDTIPSFLAEIRTMLNLGSVKEGERIIFQGIPWKINRLGMYTHLHNPALDAHFHIALSKITDLNSRPYHSDEPFFPTQKNDWVKLSDGTYGQVLSQSPENIVLSSWKSIITIPTSKFLSLSPRNLSSKAISVSIIFGLDYRYQAIATTQIKQQLAKFIQNAPKPDGLGKHIDSIKVDFKQSNASSLDFLVLCVVDGEAAGSIYPIERWLASSCIDAANYYDWIIPFQQITMHQE